MALFRFLASIPLPGINVAALQRYLETNQILGMFNMFSGGTLENFSVVAMGVAPFITASIVFQLLGMIFPKIEEMQKDSEQGRQKISQWSRMLTVPLSVIQAFGLIAILKSSSVQIVNNMNVFQLVTLITTVTGGTVFLMWIGELITEKKVGNGTSLLIFAGIVS